MLAEAAATALFAPAALPPVRADAAAAAALLAPVAPPPVLAEAAAAAVLAIVAQPTVRAGRRHGFRRDSAARPEEEQSRFLGLLCRARPTGQSHRWHIVT